MKPTSRIVLFVLVFAASFLFAQPQFKPGVERWPIKTTVSSIAEGKSPKSIRLDRLLALPGPPGVKRNDKRYQDSLIPPFKNSLKVAEGAFVKTKGWFHLVAAEDDGDYHIQITLNKEWGDSCIIVEVPLPEFVSSPKLKDECAKVRAFVRDKMLGGAEPKSTRVIKQAQYVYITGQLFYDDSHVGDKPRGKKGMRSYTLWEIHPITKMGFAKEP